MAKAPVVKVLSVDELVLDGGTQSRAAISEVTVEEYVEVLVAADGKWPFPNLDVFHDGSRYLVAEGFHRTLSAIQHGRSSIPCNVHQGTAWAAFLFGIKANQTHGLRPTQADKRHSIEKLLDNELKLTQKQIADIVGVTRRTVNSIVAERKTENEKISHSEDISDRGNPGGEPSSSQKAPASTGPVSEEAADPFGEDEDPFGQEAQQDQELPPRTPRNGKDEPVEPKRTPAEEFKLQRSKTVKTAEALMRAFDDLNTLRKSAEHQPAIKGCKALLHNAQNWK